jgi:membrane-associated protease RseP (regulator of RpoE activity)
MSCRELVVESRPVTIGHAVMRHQIFDVAPLDRLDAVEGVRMAGLVGYELFARFVVRFDYAGRTLTLIDPAHFDAAAAGTAIPFTFHEQIPEVEGTFEGLPARFDIDTGARFELTLFKPFVDRYRLRASHPRGVEAVIGWGFGGASRAYVTRASDVTIGPVRIGNVITDMSGETRGGFSSGNHQGNIGGGLLKRFIVTFDYAHRTMYLRVPRAPASDTGVFDKSGMWINESTRGFAIVDVTPGGPAAAAGLEAGDIIIAVDGRPVTDLKLYALRQQLRDAAPGTKVAFRIVKGTTRKDVNVTLRGLI